jgi:diguanylate cyclase (GGDEF)-like protein
LKTRTPTPIESVESASDIETGTDATARAQHVAGDDWFSKLADAILGRGVRRRIRTTQWLTSVLVYIGSALAMWIGARRGWVNGPEFIVWAGFLVVSLSVVYAAIRSGWSERYADPALTAAQIVLGVVGVEWGYAITGPMRSVTLLPLLLIFTFGAFSLRWRLFAWLALFALTSLVAVAAAVHLTRPGVETWSLENDDLRIDLTNVMMVTVLLPAISLVAARLSSLRSRLHSQRSQLTEALQEVQRLATHDDLTGLVNRRYMLNRLAQEQSRFQRMGHPFCIALLDMDHFKRINDLHGHARGDQVLCSFAREANAALRTSDLIARWGGEEFLLLLPGTSAAQAQVSIERLLTRVRDLSLCTGEPLTFSAGVTEFRSGETLAETIARADHAMYAAKQSGRGRTLVE